MSGGMCRSQGSGDRLTGLFFAAEFVVCGVFKAGFKNCVDLLFCCLTMGWAIAAVLFMGCHIFILILAQKLVSA